MSLLIECIRGNRWRPCYEDGKPVLCPTTAEACRTIKQLLADGVACARARRGDEIHLWGCSTEGGAAIGGRHGMSFPRSLTPQEPTC